MHVTNNLSRLFIILADNLLWPTR